MFTRMTRVHPQPTTIGTRQQTVASAPSFLPLRIQPKLTVGPVDDPFEREADRVAEQVVNGLPSGSPLPQGPQHTGRTGEAVRLKAAGPPPVAGPQSASPAVDAGIQQARGGGQPLPAPIRGAMESAFGTDFRLVRVHADSRSDHLNRSLGARAFTTGTSIFFRNGEYQPGSMAGRRLLAHELTHVVQQGWGERGLIQRAFNKEDLKEDKEKGLVKAGFGAAAHARREILPRDLAMKLRGWLGTGPKTDPIMKAALVPAFRALFGNGPGKPNKNTAIAPALEAAYGGKQLSLLKNTLFAQSIEAVKELMEESR